MEDLQSPSSSQDETQSDKREDSPSQVTVQEHFYKTLRELTPHAVVTNAMVIINVAVFVSMMIGGVSLFDPTVEDIHSWGGSFGPDTATGGWWRLLTAMFVHIGVLHILFNMWALGSAGQLVERLFGSVRFLFLYVLSGVMGGMASLYANFNIVSAGASGAIFGVFGGLFGFLIRQKKSIPMVILLNLQKSTLVFVGYNLFFGLVHPGIDNAAHIGGIFGGLLLGVLMSQPLSREERTYEFTGFLSALTVAITIIGVAGIGVNSFRGAAITAQKVFIELDALELKAQKLMDLIALEESMGTSYSSTTLRHLDEEFLPRWKELRTRVDELIGREPKNGDVESIKALSSVAEYMKTREEGFVLIVRGIRSNSEDLLNLAAGKMLLADSLASQYREEVK